MRPGGASRRHSHRDLGRSGKDVDAILPGKVMEVDDLVDAALVGFDRGELVTIPPLADETLWTAYDEARLALGRIYRAERSRTATARRRRRDGIIGAREIAAKSLS